MSELRGEGREGRREGVRGREGREERVGREERGRERREGVVMCCRR